MKRAPLVFSLPHTPNPYRGAFHFPHISRAKKRHISHMAVMTAFFFLMNFKAINILVTNSFRELDTIADFLLPFVFFFVIYYLLFRRAKHKKNHNFVLSFILAVITATATKPLFQALKDEMMLIISITLIITLIYIFKNSKKKNFFVFLGLAMAIIFLIINSGILVNSLFLLSSSFIYMIVIVLIFYLVKNYVLK